MKKAILWKCLFSSAAFFSPLVAAAAPTAELRVTGRIVPDACLTTFSDNGVVDYGAISSAEHGVTKILAKKTVSLTVSCALPSRVAIRLIDNRDSANISKMQAVSMRHRNNKNLFGLGAQTGKAAGAYLISFEPAHPAQRQTPLLESESGIHDTHWKLSSDNALRKNVLYTWDTEHKIHPGGMLNFQASFGIQTIIDGEMALPGTAGSQLDGSATFELLYL